MQEPIVPPSLEQGEKASKLIAEKQSAWKNRQYLPKIPDTGTIKTPKDPIQISMKDGRPDIRFVDVGTKFLDVIMEVLVIVLSLPPRRSEIGVSVRLRPFMLPSPFDRGLSLRS